MSKISIGSNQPSTNIPLDIYRHGTGMGWRYNTARELPRIALWSAIPIVTQAAVNIGMVHSEAGRPGAGFAGLTDNMGQALACAAVIGASFIAALGSRPVQRMMERLRLDELSCGHRAVAWHAQQRRADLALAKMATQYSRHMRDLHNSIGIK